ncbi:hypothetical protein EIZ39_13995 [Ammoniphilus sp. CFH 90114]|nr:phospholipase A2 family protein [Ammoniphilus sp. CFH 90114]RXT07249.1 hypothetical protein EIZ39_13995 [Ammoniphilus sp. CFH 90114]
MIKTNKIPKVKQFSFPCFYGNWCGPGCSGPNRPIDGLDACCRSHDRCYRRRGWRNCNCDRQLTRCAEKYADPLTVRGRMALLIIHFFSKQNCHVLRRTASSKPWMNAKIFRQRRRIFCLFEKF